MAINKDEIIRCTEEEDAIINAQIAADPDNFEWTEEHSFNAVSHPELLALHPEHAKDPVFSHTKPAKSNQCRYRPRFCQVFLQRWRPLEKTPETSSSAMPCSATTSAGEQ